MGYQMCDVDKLADQLEVASGSIFQDAVAWAVGIDVDSTPTPWFHRASEYGERAWRAVGNTIAAVCWDCGNGWMDIVTLEPLRPMGPLEFRAAAVRFYERLSDAMENPDLNSGDDFT